MAQERVVRVVHTDDLAEADVIHYLMMAITGGDPVGYCSRILAEQGGKENGKNN